MNNLEDSVYQEKDCAKIQRLSKLPANQLTSKRIKTSLRVNILPLVSVSRAHLIL